MRDGKSRYKMKPSVPLKSLDTLWLQVGGTLCNLQCTHCFVSCGPQNYNHEMMTLDQVEERLDEAASMNVKDYYITGGEVFMNPEIFQILETILTRGPLNILTNGTLLSWKNCDRLREIQSHSPNQMTFRVSMEHFEEEANDLVRGRNSWRKALEGIGNLVLVGFEPILTVTRSWKEDDDAEMERCFRNLLQERDIPMPRIKLIPPFLIGRQAEKDRPYNETEYVTEKCFEEYDIGNLQCATCRMATATGVYVCPILVDEPEGRMGNTIKETVRPFSLVHSACYTCRVTGMTCKN